MDQTLEIIVATAVLLMIALILMFIVSDRSGSFLSESDDLTSSANCDILETDFSQTSDLGEKREILVEARSSRNCGWTDRENVEPPEPQTDSSHPYIQ